MKKWILLFLICHATFSFALPIQERLIEPAALQELTSKLGIPPDADLVLETQKRWLRRSGKELWEMQELSLQDRLFVLNWAKEHKLYAPWTPACESYDKAVILGATTGHMQMRLNYLKKLWLQGTRFREIVWLTADRPLDRQVDGLREQCSTESEAARFLWETADLPKEMHELPVVFIASPMKHEGSAVKRPNTEDTLIAWLKVCPDPCSAVFVSTQPFCGYQYAVVQAALPEAFQFDVVGDGADPSSHPAAAAITLDSLARWIYQRSLYTEYHK